jgi:DNA (cytosine-5)-methyltransferase 1
VKHLDLFSGKGTFVEQAKNIFPNYECVGVCEIDPFAQQLLTRHVERGIISSDVRTLDTSQFQNVDLLTGGFPCQDISIARGKNAHGLNGAQSGLWHDMARISSQLRPRYIVIENVPALLRRGMDTVLANLAAMRYDAVWQVLSAGQFGYPHRRKRLFITAFDTDRVRREAVHLYARTVAENSIQAESRSKNLQQFERINSSEFWREDYSRFLGMDNRYSARDNSNRLRVIGNSIIHECAHAVLAALHEVHQYSE